jgi:hypothetical protein
MLAAAHQPAVLRIVLEPAQVAAHQALDVLARVLARGHAEAW